MIMFPIGLESS